MVQHVLISLEKLLFSNHGHIILIFAAKCRVNQWWKLEIVNRKLNSDQFSPLNFSNRTNGSKVMLIHIQYVQFLGARVPLGLALVKN